MLFCSFVFLYHNHSRTSIYAFREKVFIWTRFERIHKTKCLSECADLDIFRQNVRTMRYIEGLLCVVHSERITERRVSAIVQNQTRH